MKTYELENREIPDENKTVTIKENVTEERVRKTSVTQLKKQYDNIMDQIASLGEQADQIVDDITAIETNLPDIAIENKPTKVVDGTKTAPVVHKRK